MDSELKKRIIKRYLEQISTLGTVIPIERIEEVPMFTEFGNALDALESSYNALLDFQNVETSEEKRRRLSEVLKEGLTITLGAPSVITEVAPQKMKEHARDIADAIVINSLPQPDYYTRITLPHDTSQATINPLIVAARTKLAGFLSTIIVSERFKSTNSEHVKQVIKEMKKVKEEAEKAKNPERLARAEKYLTVAEDLLKVNNLAAYSIPNETGGAAHYCSLAESAGGVTEKVSLVRLDTVTIQLTRLRDTHIASVDDYMEHRYDYKLSTQAILKLPKHGDIKEVQREAIALNISRILGLDTTSSYIMTHEGKPALFVPFDDIKLMKEFAQGKTFDAFSLNPFATPKTYEHYSTINPLGAGLQGDQYIDDFGNAMSLLYICSDTDSIGGYNQNKALRDDRSLYIFDQVIMSSDKMKLDSRLNLQPDEFIKKHSRHGQGRNRTLIEDSSLWSKFDSLVRLISNDKRIYKYIDRIVNKHQQEINRLELALRAPRLSTDVKDELKRQKKQAEVLRDDAHVIRAAITNRIDKIYEIMPKRKNPGITNEHTRQALVLEKLLHNPTLFTDDGRPYKYPWTYRHKNPVKNIETLDNGNMLLIFDSKVPTHMIDFIKRQGGGDSIRLHSSKGIELSPQDLLALRETMLHPESQVRMQPDVNYLDPRDLKQISTAYGEGQHGRISNLVSKYISIMTEKKYGQEDKLNGIRNVPILLQRYIDRADDKGFGKHVLKKIHFDIQQRLQAMISLERKPANLDDAFAGALKLDRVDVFNKVIAQAIKYNKLDLPEFQNFLQSCIDEAAQARNHREAVAASTAINDLGEQLVKILKIPVLHISDVVDLDINLDEVRENELNEELDLHPLSIVLPVESQTRQHKPPEDGETKMGFFKNGKIDTLFALSMYKNAHKAALDKGLEAIGADDIALELNVLLIPILMKENLLDKKEYLRIKGLINQRDPDNLPNKEMRACTLMRQSLASVLPLCKQQQQGEQIKATVKELNKHLKNKINSEGFNETVSLLSGEKITSKQKKLQKRYDAISKLDERIKGKSTLDDADIAQANKALKTCLDNKPDWSERPLLQKLTDVLSFGFKALYRAFTSKETELEEKLDQSLKPR